MGGAGVTAGAPPAATGLGAAGRTLVRSATAATRRRRRQHPGGLVGQGGRWRDGLTALHLAQVVQRRRRR